MAVESKSDLGANVSSDNYARTGAEAPLTELMSEVVERISQRIEDKPPPPLPDTSAEDRLTAMRVLLGRNIPLDAVERIVDQKVADTPAVQFMRAFIAGTPGTIILSGGVGCGKTIAAGWGVAQRPHERYIGTHHDGVKGTWPAEYHPRFVDIAELMQLPRYGADATAALTPLKKCSILAIDDVGNETDDRNIVVAQLDGIIVSRHDNHLRTIITTNMPSELFAERYGLRVRSRVKGSASSEGCGGGFFALGDVSLRGAAL